MPISLPPEEVFDKAKKEFLSKLADAHEYDSSTPTHLPISTTSMTLAQMRYNSSGLNSPGVWPIQGPEKCSIIPGTLENNVLVL